MRIVYYFLLITMIVSCQDGDTLPKGILDRKKMTAVLSEVLIADAVVNERKVKDTAINTRLLTAAGYQRVFDLNKTTKEEFFNSYNYYLGHPDLLKVILDSANNLINNKVMEKHIPGKPEKK